MNREYSEMDTKYLGLDPEDLGKSSENQEEITESSDSCFKNCMLVS